MCLLTFFPDGVIPSDEAIQGLKIGAMFNSDGHGYAIVNGEHIIVRRGMQSDAVIQSFVNHRTRYPDGPALFHSRIGTGGSLTKRNCHPFYIGQDHKTVLAHNGILAKTAQPPKGDLRSDTRYLAEVLLPDGGFGDPITCKSDRAWFEDWLTPYNKVVILTANPKYKVSSIVLNEQSGEWAHGVWWSNDSYCPYTYRYSGAISRWSNEGGAITTYYPPRDPNEYTCKICNQANAVDKDYRVCWSCGMCADCEQSWSKGDCLCYVRKYAPRVETLTTDVLGAPPVLDNLDDRIDDAIAKLVGISCSVCKKDMIVCECEFRVRFP